MASGVLTCVDWQTVRIRHPPQRVWKVQMKMWKTWKKILIIRLWTEHIQLFPSMDIGTHLYIKVIACSLFRSVILLFLLFTILLQF